MKTKPLGKTIRAAFFAALALAGLSPAVAQLSSQYGILDLAANGGINPNTGLAWQAGDQYRLAFHSDVTIDATSNDPAVYDAFATAQANQSTLGDGSITTSTGWTAMVWVNTDNLQNQGLALSNPSVRAGITDTTGGEAIGGAGVPVYAMDGTTSIARNNAVIMSGAWKSPFANVDSGWGPNGVAADSTVRLPVGAGNANTQTVHYAPFLDQFAGGDTGAQHGADVWTGGFPGGHVNALGPAADNTTTSRGSSNANNSGRVWNRFTGQNTDANSVYALSPLLTIADPADVTPPTLVGTDIVDDKLGGPVLEFETVTYTVTFSEPMDSATVNVGDFENASATAISVDSVSTTGNPAVFEVAVTPTAAGTLQIQVAAGAVLTDVAGNPLDTTAAIADDTTITVDADTVAPTLIPADIEDDKFGGPILENETVTYTVYFSKAMDASTVEVTDFGNVFSTAVTIDSVTVTGDPSIFTVVATPTEAGTLQLRVNSGAVLTDLPGNPLDTTSSINDDTTITVDADLIPTVVSFVDNVSGGPIDVTESVIYAVTFSEGMNASTVEASDFENATLTGITIDSVTATGDPAVFDVAVSPLEAGTIQLQIAAGANLEDPTGNPVDTTSAIPDDTTITVNDDLVAPTLVSIVDNVSGGPVLEGQSVTYTVTFDEGMDDLTFEIADFENATATAATIDSVSATGDPAVFLVVATPTEVGSLQLQIAMGATLTDLVGNPLDTSSALPDNDIITVDAAPDLEGQYGILSFTANGGINPNTGNPWQAGDQYRLAFHTDATIAGTSNDPAVYDAFATAQANQSTLGNGAITSSTGWTALVWVNTDSGQNQGLALSDPSVRAGITDTTGGEAIGGAGVPVYAMDGTTSIARNNAVIMSGAWKSPFANVDSGWGPNGVAADSTLRLPVGAGNSNSQTVHYAPFLDQFAAGDTGAQHGADVWTGGFPGSHVNALGPAADNTTSSRGSSNANNSGRVWNRFTGQNTDANTVYALSPLLTVVAGGGDYATWAALYPSLDLTDPDADLDGDGLTNNEERLFGLDPGDPASQNPYVAPLDSDAGTFSFTRRDNALTGLFTDIETSTDLIMWTVDSGAVLVDGTPDGFGIETVGVTLSPGLLSAPTLFVRVNQNEGIILSENFEANNGGFTFSTSAGSDWEHGDPDSVGEFGGSVTEGNGGSTNCWGTKLGDFTGTADRGYYTDPTTTLLRSAIIDLTGVAAATLTFAEALDIEAGDSAVVNIIDDTTDTVISAAIYTADDSAGSSDANWNAVPAITIPGAALGQAVRIEWSFTGLGGTTDDYIGWYIDDVSVKKAQP